MPADDRPTPTPDGRHLVIDGRRWRTTDPAIPEKLRAELVSELMSARRAVKAGRQSGDEEAVAAARLRVDNAKVALGERGQPWWEVPTSGAQANRARCAILALLAKRGPTSSICPSDVARTIAASTSWRSWMPLVRQVAADLARAGAVRITSGQSTCDPDADWSGPVRIRLADPGRTGG